MVDEQEYTDEQGLDLTAIVSATKRFKIGALSIAGLVLIIGMAIIFLLPTSYQSTATILLKEPEVPQALVQTTVTVFAAAQIQYINQRVMTRSNLARIIEQFDLYKDKRRYMPSLLLTEEVRSNMLLNLINVEVTDPGGGAVLKAIAFSLGFEDENPAIAQQVANELVSLYMEENVRSRTVQTAETSEFMGGEVERLDEEVQKLEEQLAEFKKVHADSLPAMMGTNQQLNQRTEDEIRDIGRRLDSLDDTRIFLDAQLAQISPTSPMMLPDGSVVVSPQDQLKALQTRLAMLEGKYSSDHPDVQRARRELDALRAETGLTADLTETKGLLVDARTELAKAREIYRPDHPEILRLERMVDNYVMKIKESRSETDELIEPDNPAYIQLTAQKNALDAQERALIEDRRKLRAQLEVYEGRMLRTPGVEQELQALSRELQSATGRYFAARDRQFGAEMGEALESQSKGERFVLVEPANYPLEPSWPNRPMLLTLLLVLSPGMGIGWIFLMLQIRNSIWSAKMLESIQGIPPIAEIPRIFTEAERSHTRRVRIAVLAGLPVVLLLGAVTIHLLVRPLDVLWFVTLRKLGI